MSDTRISHHCWAAPTPDGKAWRGKFSAPGVGVAYVRDEEGLPIRFESEERALIAAQRALCNRLDGPRPERSPKAMTFVSVGQGRTKRFAPQRR